MLKPIMLSLPFFQPQRRCHNRGLTLVEIIVVLAIMGLIIGGIWISVAASINNHKKARLMEQLITINENVRDYLRQVPIPAVPTEFTTDAVDMKLFPADMIKIVNGTPVTLNAYGGDIALWYGPENHGPYYQIYTNHVPKAACVDLIVKFGNTDDMISDIAANGPGQIPPISLDSARAMCDRSYNNFYIFFRLQG